MPATPQDALDPIFEEAADQVQQRKGKLGPRGSFQGLKVPHSKPAPGLATPSASARLLSPANMVLSSEYSAVQKIQNYKRAKYRENFKVDLYKKIKRAEEHTSRYDFLKRYLQRNPLPCLKYHRLDDTGGDVFARKAVLLELSADARSMTIRNEVGVSKVLYGTF